MQVLRGESHGLEDTVVESVFLFSVRMPQPGPPASGTNLTLKEAARSELTAKQNSGKQKDRPLEYCKILAIFDPMFYCWFDSIERN